MIDISPPPLEESPILDYTIKYQLLLYHLTNNLKLPEEPSEGLVHRLYAIVTGPISSKVFSYIDRTPVFVARSIWWHLGVSKQEVYDVINALIRHSFIKQTDLPLSKPPGRYEGAKAKLYMYRDITLDKLTYLQDPRVKEACRQYWETFKTDGEVKKSTDNVRINISTEVIDHYISKHRVGKYQTPSPIMIEQKIKHDYPDVDPTHAVNLSQALFQKLYLSKTSE